MTGSTSAVRHARAATLHLRGGGTSVLLDTTTPGMPTIVHWGPDLGDLTNDVSDGIARAARPQRVSGGLDVTPRLTLLPQEAHGWQGTPGLVGSRHGRDFSSALETTSIEASGSGVTIAATDPRAALALSLTLVVTPTGIVTMSTTLTNTGDDGYRLDELALTLPVPSFATELLDTTGRHMRERFPQRHAFTAGRHVRESRRGRPGADATLLLLAGRPGFGFERGTVFGLHLGWSGNHTLGAEKLPGTPGFLRAAELLAPGEVVLGPGESYTTPTATASWGEGLDELAGRIHEALRARPRHPALPRPVTVNTWEAVYFDHDLDHLVALAETAAAAGVERFVLDDGWFRGRRDDLRGLGDWTVDESVWPDGLHPLFDRVTELGMQCGLWVEPEMVNVDSELGRAHPEWMLQSSGRLPVEGRQQQVLDLSNPAAYAFVLGGLDALLDDYAIDYLKWDHNRDLVEAGSTITGTSAVHDNVVALYRLFDELKLRHPGLEIESCASGGARVDLGVLDHTDRIWTSDTIDPLERLTIQKYTGLLVPYELMGAHVGGPRAHTTGRRHDLSFRAGVALFGHFGIEWDLTTASALELAEVAEWVRLHKRWRGLLHSGRSVHADLSDPAQDLRGVVAHDGSAALFVYAATGSTASYPPDPLTFPGLDDSATYRVTLASGPSVGDDFGQSPLAWADEPLFATGRALARVGVRPPVLHPDQLQVFVLERAPVLEQAPVIEQAPVLERAPGARASAGPRDVEAAP